MTRKFLRVVATIVLAGAPTFASAQPHGGGGRPGGGGGGAARPAPMMRQAPAAAPERAPSTGNFNFNRDIAPPEPRAPISRPAMPARPETVARPVHAAVVHPDVRRPNEGGTHVAYRRAPATESATGGPFHGRFIGHRIDNPRGPRGNWGWNRGVAWHPASAYWGGGFWGDYALASIAAIGIFGAIDDSQDGYAYDSYRVQPDTPGADLLNDYGLEQTGCGPPGLVAIWGPDGSVICAIPNGNIGPGNYQVDPETFTLVPAT
jgi:hypothetical protein